MRFIQRVFLTLAVLAFLATPLMAQELEVTAVGSGIVNPVFGALADEAGISATIEATGNNTGFEQFCGSAADFVNTTRAIEVTEENTCGANSVEFYEVLIGYDVLAYIANPDLTFLQCLSTQQINDILAPTAVENATWDSINAQGAADSAVNVFLPPANTTTYALLENDVTGFGFRADAQTLDSSADVIEAVANDPGGFGVVQFSAIPEDANVTILDVRNDAIGQCVSPGGDAIANGSYLEGTPLYMYINSGSSAADPMLDLLANADATTEVVQEARFTAPSAADFEIIAEFVEGRETGRQFSLSVTEFRIPPTISGTVTVGGAAGAFTFLNAANTAFTQQYQNVTPEINIEGVPAGLRRLCNGEIDMVATYSPLDEETLNNCEAVDVDVLEIEIGRQAVVLVANEADSYLTCVTTEQIVDTWGVDSPELPTNWQDVSDEFPDQEFILFTGTTLGDDIPNIMLTAASGGNVPLRQDTEQNPDPLYRAAAVANVEGALTYMSWNEYQEVLDNEQERIQLVSVDDGDGCVTPSEETIASGEYPLARSIRLAISQRALERGEVQGFSWFLFQDNRFGELERLDFVSLSLRDLSDIRETLQTAFDEANAAASARLAASATEEAVEAAPPADVTPEPAVETEAPAEEMIETEEAEAAEETSTSEEDAAATEETP